MYQRSDIMLDTKHEIKYGSTDNITEIPDVKSDINNDLINSMPHIINPLFQPVIHIMIRDGSNTKRRNEQNMADINGPLLAFNFTNSEVKILYQTDKLTTLSQYIDIYQKFVNETNYQKNNNMSHNNLELQNNVLDNRVIKQYRSNINPFTIRSWFLTSTAKIPNGVFPNNFASAVDILTILYKIKIRVDTFEPGNYCYQIQQDTWSHKEDYKILDKAFFNIPGPQDILLKRDPYPEYLSLDHEGNPLTVFGVKSMKKCDHYRLFVSMRYIVLFILTMLTLGFTTRPSWLQITDIQLSIYFVTITIGLATNLIFEFITLLFKEDNDNLLAEDVDCKPVKRYYYCYGILYSLCLLQNFEDVYLWVRFNNKVWKYYNAP